MKVYLDDIEISFTDLAITNFDNMVQANRKLKHTNSIEFSSIGKLKGNKELINKAFKDQLDESIIE